MCAGIGLFFVKANSRILLDANTIPFAAACHWQMVVPVEFNASGHLIIIAYFLHPPVMKAFFGFDAKEVTDKRAAPKMFRKICQFDGAFRQLNQGKFSRLADLAYEHDYADPSHFIRVFREFTHHSPGEYLKNMPDV